MKEYLQNQGVLRGALLFAALSAGQVGTAGGGGSRPQSAGSGGAKRNDAGELPGGKRGCLPPPDCPSYETYTMQEKLFFLMNPASIRRASNVIS